MTRLTGLLWIWLACLQDTTLGLSNQLATVRRYLQPFRHRFIVDKSDVPMQRLSIDLLNAYHKGQPPGSKVNSRPVSDPSEAINISVAAQLYQIVNVDQVMNTIRLTAAFDMNWTDQFLTWTPEDYQNATEIFLPAAEIWTPELSLLYSLNSDPLPKDSLEVAVTYEGKVRYFLAFTAETLCPYEVKLFPFDKQNCTLQFGSLVHTVKTMDLTPKTHIINTDNFYDNQEWILTECIFGRSLETVNSSGVIQSHAYLTVQLFIERQSFYYIFNLVLPGAVVTLVAVVGFHVPGRLGLRDSKFHLGLVTLMSMSVLLLGIVDDLPKFSLNAVAGKRGSFSSVPLLGIYYFCLLSLISLSCITTSLFVLIQRRYEDKKSVPLWLLWLTPKLFAARLTERKERQMTMKLKNESERANSLRTVSNHMSTTVSTTLEESTNLLHTTTIMSEEQPDVSLMGRLVEVQQTLAEIRHHVYSVAERKQFKAKQMELWPTVLFRLSAVSFVFYMGIYFLVILLFFQNGWYS